MSIRCVSIIIPVYRVEAYLHECLDSVLSQTYANWEAVCVDDGSPDGCGAILDEYAKRDDRFAVIHKQNEGVSVARNVALNRARGEYITFLDADDVVAPDWLENYWQVISSTGADMVRIRVTEFHDGQSIPCEWKKRDRCVVFEEGAISRGQLAEIARHGYTCACCYRSELVRDVRFPVGVVLAEDTLFNFKVLSRLGKFVQCDYAGYFYRQRSQSGSHRVVGECELAAYLQACANLFAQGLPSELRRIVSIFCWVNSTWWMASFPQCCTPHVRRVILALRNNRSLCFLDYRWGYRLLLFVYSQTGWRWPLVFNKVLRDWLSKMRRRI